MRKNPDVIVVGAGVIGLSLAWRLAQRGASVLVAEQGPSPADRPAYPFSGQASWAAAGVLSPLTEVRGNTRLMDLGMESLRRYPTFTGELTDASGVYVAPEGPGLLRLDPEGSDYARGYYDLAQELGLPAEWLTAAEVGSLTPALAQLDQPAFLSLREQHLSPRRLLNALDVACQMRGVQFSYGFRVRRITEASGPTAALRSVESVSLAHIRAGCGDLLIAAGAWSPIVLKSLGVDVPVRPIRGQVITLQSSAGLTHTVYTPGGVLLPREGRLLVGSTEEDVGFRFHPPAAALDGLMSLAVSLHPRAWDSGVVESAMGFRPGTPDHLPILGTAPGWENLHIATGHFRKGILLAPLTADWMADSILERRLAPGMAGLGLERFGDNSAGGEGPR